MLSEKAKRNQTILIKCVDERIGIDRHRGSVEHDLVKLCQLLEEEIYSWTDEDVDWDRSALNDYSHMKIVLALSSTGLYMCK